MSDECCGFCCLCFACFGIFGQDGCLDCCSPGPKGNENKELEQAARAKEYELFTQAQPGPQPPPHATVITAADPDTMVNSGVAEKSKHSLGDSREQPAPKGDRITEHEDRLRRSMMGMDTSPEVEVQETPVLAPASSLPVVTAADPENLPDISAGEEKKLAGVSGDDKDARNFEEEFPKDNVAAHKEKAEEYYYWGGGGSS